MKNISQTLNQFTFSVWLTEKRKTGNKKKEKGNLRRIKLFLAKRFMNDIFQNLGTIMMKPK